MTTHILRCILLTVLFFGCNRVQELNPGSGVVPDETIGVVKKKYPAASELVFKSLSENREWMVNFQNLTEKHAAVVTRTAFLSDARLTGAGVPDSLLRVIDKLSIRGGTFSNFREVAPTSVDPHPQAMADYQLNADLYTVRWTWYGTPIAYEVTMTPQVSLEYFTDDVSNLPDQMKNMYTGSSMWREPGRIKVYVNAKGEITYRDLGYDRPYSTVGVFAQSGRPLYYLYWGDSYPNYLVNPTDFTSYPQPMQDYIHQKILAGGKNIYLIHKIDHKGEFGYFVSDSRSNVGYESPDFHEGDFLYYHNLMPIFVNAFQPVREANGYMFDMAGNLTYRQFVAQVFQ